MEKGRHGGGGACLLAAALVQQQPDEVWRKGRRGEVLSPTSDPDFAMDLGTWMIVHACREFFLRRGRGRMNI
jgi:hypothetical protein